MGISSSPTRKHAGIATKTTRPAYGFASIPVNMAITSAQNTTAEAVVTSTPAIATGWESASRFIRCARYLRVCKYATRPSISAAGSDPYLFGIGGFFVDLTFAVISVG